jgi:methylated-DNA-[protein]-cysteine S-methyltransferase
VKQDFKAHREVRFFSSEGLYTTLAATCARLDWWQSRSSAAREGSANGQEGQAAMKPQTGSELFSAIVAAPFGAVGIRSDTGPRNGHPGGQLRELVYLPPHFEEKDAVDAVSAEAAAQLARYFADPDFRFDLPLLMAGSPFQQRVWQAISSIPRGSVLTYGRVARDIGSAARAVGQACGANWFPLIIPCHRVTAAGDLGGFSNHGDAAGFHVGVKRWLLAHEGVTRY